ncbi:MAG TPA: class I SAM-dependent methyltransferase [Thermoanaerobaculia bacterium]|nr:class I SAM-dependent methyltransferase [Thermoanaerobaculia bacterium]
MVSVKSLYHRLVPTRIRNPIGLLRRRAWDGMVRSVSWPRLPPPGLLMNVQMSPYLNEYLTIGRRSAASLMQALQSVGIDTERPASILDLGCGSARVLRHFSNTRWDLHGADIDAEAIEWASRYLRFAKFQLNGTNPPLSYEAARFDAVFAFSLFTHFTPEMRSAWCAEIHRVLAPGGFVMISTLGASALPNYPVLATPLNQEQLVSEGTFFVKQGTRFNEQVAFHSRAGIERLFSCHFSLISWKEQGLDGFQDFSILQRRAIEIP